MEPRTLGKYPSTCQATKSDAADGPSWFAPSITQGGATGLCCQLRRQCIQGSQEFPVCWAEEVVGLAIIHLPFLLRRKFHPTLIPLAPLPLLASLSSCYLCFESQGWWNMPFHHSGWGLSLPESPTHPWCPALLITRTQCNVGLCSRADLQGQLYSPPGPLTPHRSVPLPSAWRLGAGGSWALCPSCS